MPASGSLEFLGSTGRQAVLTGPSSVAIVNGRQRSLTAGEARIDIAAALTCSNDVRDFVAGHSLVFGSPPVPLGHESAGVIVEAAAGWAGPPVGSRVAMVLRTFCRKCVSCRTGDLSRCETPRRYSGVFGDDVIAPSSISQEDFLTFPQTVQPSVAALTDAVACAAAAVSRLAASGRVLVTGAGLIGLIAALLLRIRGHSVVVASRRPNGLARAQALALAARPADALGTEPFDAAVDTTGAPEPIAMALASLRGQGRLLLMSRGTSGRDLRIRLPVSRVVRDGITIEGSYHHDPSHRVDAAQVLTTHTPIFQPLLTRGYDVADAGAALFDVHDDRHVRSVIGPDVW